MPYVGRDLQRGNYLKLDDIGSSFNGSTTTFNLTSGGNAFFPGSAFSILVSLGGVVQEPESAYQIDRSQIIFATAPTSSSDFFCIALGVALGVGVPGHNTVGNNQLAKPLSYGDYFRWDSANNRVGINTLLPSTALDVVGDATFSGAVSIGGTLTYEDVANIDAVGIITARAGIEDKTLTAGRVVYAGAAGRLVDNANFTFDGNDVGIARSIFHLGDTNCFIGFPAADQIVFEGGGHERFRINGTTGKYLFGRDITGRSARYNNTGVVPTIQIEDDTEASFSVAKFSNNTDSSRIYLQKGRGSTGSAAVVQDDDTLGMIVFNGYNGSGFRNAAQILAEVDGEPTTSGDNTDMPGALVFKTSADGTSAPVSYTHLTLPTKRIV